MSASCEEIYLEKRVFISKESLIAKFRFSEFWVYWIKRCHLFSIMRITTNEGFDISFLVFHFSNNEREICFFYGAFCYFELECVHSTIIFCNHDDTTGIFVEAMNDTWFFYSVYYGWILTSCFLVFDFCHRERSVAIQSFWILSYFS